MDCRILWIKPLTNGEIFQDSIPQSIRKTGKSINEYFKRMKEFFMIKGPQFSTFLENMDNSL